MQAAERSNKISQELSEIAQDSEVSEALRARVFMTHGPRPSPIYSSLLEQPEDAIEFIVREQGCDRAAALHEFLREFEGDDSPAVQRVETRLASFCDLFVRGDANFDREIDVSDAIATLGFLFAGLPARVCEDAADANDDGRVDIADPLFLLNLLFECPDSQLPPPNDRPGRDPTEEMLGCVPRGS
jgi:hypothetical protein